MSIQFYADDAKAISIKQEEIFRGAGSNFALTKLVAADVEFVYKWSGTAYTKLIYNTGFTLNTHYKFTGNTINLKQALTASQHIIAMPTVRLNMSFTGIANSAQVLTKRLVIDNNGATTFHSLRLLSEDFSSSLVPSLNTFSGAGYYYYYDPYNPLVNLGLYDANGQVITDETHFALQGFDTYLDPEVYRFCPVIIDSQYIGDCVQNTEDTLFFLRSNAVILPVTNDTSSTLEIYPAGDIRFAISYLNGPIPADDAFKRICIIPTLTPTDPTAYVWLRESVIIPVVIDERPATPFKLIGDEI